MSGARVNDRWLPLHYALREMRGGLSGFYVFVACITLGAMAIAGVGSLAASLADSLSREGQVILGGDLSFTLIQREASDAEKEFLRSRGALSSAATLRAMARTSGDGQATLVELKAVDAAYPLYGAVTLDPPGSLADALALRDGACGAAADPTLLTRLAIKPGTRLTIGNAAIEIRATLTSEPDKLAGGIGFGPRLLVGEAALRATGLVQPGSLVRWNYRLRLPSGDNSDNAAKAVTAQVRAALPQAGWEIRSRSNASPQLERNVDRFTQFLTIVGLTALLVGGVGVGNAVKSHLDRRRETIATMKALGASGSRIFSIYLTQVLLLALVGGIIGAALGAILPFAISWTFGAIIPLPLVPALHPAELLLAIVYGLLTALAFALWPLGRAHDVPVGALFRDMVAAQPSWPRRIYIVFTVLAVLSLASVAVLLAYDRRVAIIYVGVAAAVFLLLRLVGSLLMTLARRAPCQSHRPAHGGCQYPPPRRTDADHRVVAGPRHRVASDGDRDRRQPAPALRQRTAGQGAVVLLPRHSGGTGNTVRQFHPRAGPRRQAGGSADAARPHCLGQRHSRRESQAEGRGRLGAAERPRHHL